MKSFKYLIVIGIIFKISFGFAQEESETRRLDSFSTLKVSGIAQVKLIQGIEESLTLHTKNLSPEDVITEVKGNTLTIKLKGNKKYQNIELRILLKIRNLSSISAKGAVVIENESMLQTEELSLNTDGAVRLDMKLNVQKLQVNSSGANELELEGKAIYQKVTLNGAGKVSNYNLETSSSDVTVNGVGSIEVNIKDKLIAEVNGVGRISYKDAPNSSVQVQKNGLGVIERFQ